MIADGKVMGFVPTTDAAKARGFYEGVLGLRFVSDDPFALVVASGETEIRVTKMKEFTPAPFTVLGWQVEDIDAEIRVMAERGVRFNRYPGLEQSEMGVWDAPGGARIAWFSDPDGNVLSVSQHP